MDLQYNTVQHNPRIEPGLHNRSFSPNRSKLPGGPSLPWKLWGFWVFIICGMHFPDKTRHFDSPLLELSLGLETIYFRLLRLPGVKGKKQNYGMSREKYDKIAFSEMIVRIKVITLWTPFYCIWEGFEIQLFDSMMWWWMTFSCLVCRETVWCWALFMGACLMGWFNFHQTLAWVATYTTGCVCRTNDEHRLRLELKVKQCVRYFVTST